MADKIEQLQKLMESWIEHGYEFGAISGPFDIIHEGHLAYMKAAKEFRPKNYFLIAIVNSDKYLIYKHGYAALSFDTRLSIVSSIRYVDFVIPWDEINVAGALEILRPSYFFNSGDRKPDNQNNEERSVCIKHGIQEIFLDLPKVNSSSGIKQSIWTNQLKKLYTFSQEYHSKYDGYSYRFNDSAPYKP